MCHVHKLRGRQTRKYLPYLDTSYGKLEKKSEKSACGGGFERERYQTNGLLKAR